MMMIEVSKSHQLYFFAFDASQSLKTVFPTIYQKSDGNENIISLKGETGFRVFTRRRLFFD